MAPNQSHHSTQRLPPPNTLLAQQYMEQHFGGRNTSSSSSSSLPELSSWFEVSQRPDDDKERLYQLLRLNGFRPLRQQDDDTTIHHKTIDKTIHNHNDNDNNSRQIIFGSVALAEGVVAHPPHRTTFLLQRPPIASTSSSNPQPTKPSRSLSSNLSYSLWILDPTKNCDDDDDDDDDQPWFVLDHDRGATRRSPNNNEPTTSRKPTSPSTTTTTTTTPNTTDKNDNSFRQRTTFPPLVTVDQTWYRLLETRTEQALRVAREQARQWVHRQVREPLQERFSSWTSSTTTSTTTTTSHLEPTDPKPSQSNTQGNTQSNTQSNATMAQTVLTTTNDDNTPNQADHHQSLTTVVFLDPKRQRIQILRDIPSHQYTLLLPDLQLRHKTASTVLQISLVVFGALPLAWRSMKYMYLYPGLSQLIAASVVGTIAYGVVSWRHQARTTQALHLSQALAPRVWAQDEAAVQLLQWGAQQNLARSIERQLQKQQQQQQQKKNNTLSGSALSNQDHILVKTAQAIVNNETVPRRTS